MRYFLLNNEDVYMEVDNTWSISDGYLVNSAGKNKVNDNLSVVSVKSAMVDKTYVDDAYDKDYKFIYDGVRITRRYKDQEKDRMYKFLAELKLV